MSLRPCHFRGNKKYFHLILAREVSAFSKEADWLESQKILIEMQKIFSIEIQSYVMMDSHQHLLLATDRGNENYFSEAVQLRLDPSDLETIRCEQVRTLSQYLNTYKYIYRNPLEAGLCAAVEKYPYSSIYALLGKSKMPLEVFDQLGLIQNPYHILSWLNSEENFKYSKMSWLD